MTGSEDDRPRKAQRRRGHVTLIAHGTPSERKDASVIVGRCLRDDVVAQSGLLAGLGQTEGSAALPDGITPGDLHLWQTACVYPLEPSIEDLATILKVADVVGADTAKWIGKFSIFLQHFEWEDHKAADAMVVTLLSLPNHLLQAILSGYLTHQTLADLISELPLPLHTSLIAAATSSGKLDVPEQFREDEDKFLLALSATVFPPPGLLSVKTEAGDMSTVTFSNLARSLSAHPSITFLDMASSICQPHALHAFAAVCKATGSLRALETLRVNILAHPSGCAALADCLRRLPALTELNPLVWFSKADAQPTAQRAPNRDLEAVSAPACLPNLQRLTFFEDACDSKSKYAERDEKDPSSLFLFLPIVKMPSLSYVSFQSDACDVPLNALASGLSALPSLQELHLDYDVCAASEDKPLPELDVEVRLPRMQWLKVSRPCPVEALEAASLIAPLASASLTSLVVVGLGMGFSRSTKISELACVLPALAQCTGLQRLELQTTGEERETDPPQDGPDGSTQHSTPERRCSAALRITLQQLTGLTALMLRSGLNLCAPNTQSANACMLCAANVAAGLLALTGLEELHVGMEDQQGRRLAVTQPQVLLDACAALPRLRVLGLGLEGLKRQDVVAVLPRLPCLTVLRLPANVFGGPDGAGPDFSDVTAHLPRCKIEMV